MRLASWGARDQASAVTRLTARRWAGRLSGASRVGRKRDSGHSPVRWSGLGLSMETGPRYCSSMFNARANLVRRVFVTMKIAAGPVLPRREERT